MVTANGNNGHRKHIVLVVPRGEAVRNFLYSETLRYLGDHARVTLLTVIDDEEFNVRFQPHCDDIIHLKQQPGHKVINYLRLLTDTAHDRWIDSEVARNRSAIRDVEAETSAAKLKRLVLKSAASTMANNRALQLLTSLENRADRLLSSREEFVTLFERIKPDLVFNCSHIHGAAGELPLKVAHDLGIPTAGFIFSWDNLTSRSRIFVPYDYYLVWNELMREQLLSTYPAVPSENVFITGTPQFDFHFRSEFWLERDELCRRIGANPEQPMVLYTTGIDRHFPEEHRHVELVARLLDEMDLNPKPQLIVRMYVKGTSQEMKDLMKRGLPNVVFPPILWEPNWFTPKYEDLTVYTNLLRHIDLGINVASTVTLELMMHDKPVMNIGYDPPGSDLNPAFRFERHINFDHYRPIVESGAVMVARSPEDMREMIYRGLTNPSLDSDKRKRYLQEMLGSTLDGKSGERVAVQLMQLTVGKPTARRETERKAIMSSPGRRKSYHEATKS
jgi:hypothetical protein